MICVECGAAVKSVYRGYGEGRVRLTKCVSVLLNAKCDGGTGNLQLLRRQVRWIRGAADCAGVGAAQTICVSSPAVQSRPTSSQFSRGAFCIVLSLSSFTCSQQSGSLYQCFCFWTPTSNGFDCEPTFLCLRRFHSSATCCCLCWRLLNLQRTLSPLLSLSNFCNELRGLL